MSGGSSLLFHVAMAPLWAQAVGTSHAYCDAVARLAPYEGNTPAPGDKERASAAVHEGADVGTTPTRHCL
jgi:hypothetical protein